MELGNPQMGQGGSTGTKEKEGTEGAKSFENKIKLVAMVNMKHILDFSRSFSAASETGLFAAPPTTGKRTGARLLGTNALCL